MSGPPASSLRHRVTCRASLGALAGTRLHADFLRRLFGAFLLLVAVHMMLGRHGR